MPSATKTATLYSNGGHPYTLKASFEETDTSTANNTSTLTCTAQLIPISNYWSSQYFSSLAIYWHDNKTNSDAIVSTIGFYGIGQGETKTASGNIITYHKDDGTLSGYAYAVFTKGQTTSNLAPNSGSVATDLTPLTPIDRYPLLTSAPNFTDEEDPIITYTTTSGFTNPTTYACISLDGTTDNIAYRQVDISSGTYTFELTASERNTLKNATPNSNTLNVTFILKTTVGADNYYSKLVRQMSVINANPTFTHTETETNAKVVSVLGSNSASSVIQNASIVQVSVTPTALKGSSIASVRVSCGLDYSETKTTSPYTFDVPITTVGSMVITVTDSRSNSAATAVAKTLISYMPVSIGVYSFVRYNPTSSNIILNMEAVYQQQTFGSTPNVPTVKWKLDEGNYTTISSSNYTIDTVNNKLTITDYELTNALVYTLTGQFTIYIEDLLTTDQESGTDGYVTKGVPTYDEGEHDLQVNGDLFIADTDGENAVSVLPLIQPKLLWTNPNPNVGFTGQQVTLSSDDYDMLEIFFYDYINTNRLNSIRIPKGESSNIFSLFDYSSGMYMGRRTANNDGDTTVTISGCYSVITNSTINVTLSNEWMIPVYIVGYNTGLF